MPFSSSDQLLQLSLELQLFAKFYYSRLPESGRNSIKLESFPNWTTLEFSSKLPVNRTSIEVPLF